MAVFCVARCKTIYKGLIVCTVHPAFHNDQRFSDDKMYSMLAWQDQMRCLYEQDNKDDWAKNNDKLIQNVIDQC